MQRKILGAICLMLLVFTLIASPLQSASSECQPPDLPDVIDFKNVFIPQNATVEHVMVFGGNVIIAGKVADEVVVINGNLSLLPTAQLEKRAFVLGGRLSEETGATVKKGIINLEASSTNITSILLAAMLISLWGFIQLTVAFALLIILPALSWGFQSRYRQLEWVCRSACGKAIALGLLSGLAFLLLECLLIVSVVGLPLAFVLAFCFLLVAIVGTSGVCLAIGGKIVAKTGEFEKPSWQQTFYGTIVVVMAANIPFLGPLIFLFTLLLGVGLISLALFQRSGDL